MLVYPPGLLCWELRQFLNPPCERASLLPSLCYSSGCAGAQVLPPQCWSPCPSPQGNGLLLTCFLWSTVQRLQSRGKLFCCKAQALPSQPPIGLLRWECIYLLGLGLFLWKKLLWAGVVLGESAGLLSRARSCHCGCSRPGTGTTKLWAGICVQSSVRFLCPTRFLCPVGLCILLSVFILPLQKASSLENMAKHEAESSAFAAEMCASAEVGEGQGNGFILIGEG